MEGYDKVQDGECDGKGGYVSEVLQLLYHQNYKNQLTLPPQVKLVGSCFRAMSAAMRNRAVELQAKRHCRCPVSVGSQEEMDSSQKRSTLELTKYMETDLGSP